MLLPSLQRFNKALADFQIKFPRPQWSDEFKQSLINDFSFFSSRIEDPELKQKNLNHFLQTNSNGSVTKVYENPETISVKVLDTIYTWIDKNKRD